MKTIIYENCTEWACRPTYRTEQYGSLLGDKFYGEINGPADDDDDDDYECCWSGFFCNVSRPELSEFAFFSTRTAATRWVNKQLRANGLR